MTTETLRIRNVLPAKVTYLLTKMVEEGYTSSGLSDADFARKAEGVLECPVTGHNVAGVRDCLGIPNNFFRQRRPDELGGKLAELESRVARLEMLAKVARITVRSGE